jgi:hypothetical protein
VLERGDEREPDRLALDELVSRIGGRLDPGHLGPLVEVLDHRRRRRAEIHRPRPALTPLEQVEADVRGDPVEPRAQRGAPLEPVAAAPCA